MRGRRPSKRSSHVKSRRGDRPTTRMSVGLRSGKDGRQRRYLPPVIAASTTQGHHTRGGGEHRGLRRQVERGSGTPLRKGSVTFRAERRQAPTGAARARFVQKPPGANRVGPGWNGLRQARVDLDAERVAPSHGDLLSLVASSRPRIADEDAGRIAHLDQPGGQTLESSLFAAPSTRSSPSPRHAAGPCSARATTRGRSRPTNLPRQRSPSWDPSP